MRKKPRKPLCFHWRGGKRAGFAYRAHRNENFPRQSGASPTGPGGGGKGRDPIACIFRPSRAREILRREILRKKRRKFHLPRGATCPYIYILARKKPASTPLFPLESLQRSRFSPQGTQELPGEAGTSAGVCLPSHPSEKVFHATGAPVAPVPPEIRAEIRRGSGLNHLPGRGFLLRKSREGVDW